MREHERETLKFMYLMERKLIRFQIINEKFVDDNFSDQRKYDEFVSIIDVAQRSDILNPDELIFYDSYHEIKGVQAEMVKFEDNFDAEYEEKSRMLTMPVFVERHPVLKKAWIEKWEQFVKPMFPINESIFVPRTQSVANEFFDSKISAAVADDLDASKTITYDKEGIAKKLKDYSFKDKNEEKVRKAMILGEIMNNIAEEIEENPALLDFKQQIFDQKEDFVLNDFKLTDGRIFTEEIPYVLFLNNSKPRFYNVDFFAEYFQMDRKDFKTMFRYISFPIINNKDQKVDRILRFVDIK